LLLLALTALFALTWVSAGAVRAAKDKHEDGQAAKDAKKEGGEHTTPGEPPIFTPVRLDLGLWTLVVFLLLLFILSKYAWGPMLAGLKKREENIRAAIDDAQKARDEAQQLRADLAKERAKIAEETRAAMDEARRAAQQLRDDLVAQAKTDIQTERDRLRREIESARDQALKQLWDQTAQLATLVSAKAIRRELTPGDHRRLVDEALADLRGAGQMFQQLS
jgi:F-type H+-transporting ATPase subunit b